MKIKFFKIPFIKRFLPRSLLARSLLILVVPIVLTLIISTYIFFNRHWDTMASRLAAGVAGEINFLVEQVRHGPADMANLELSRLSQRDMQINFGFIPGGEIVPDPYVYRGRGNIIKEFLAKELDSKLQYPYRIMVDVEEKWTKVQVQIEQGVLVFVVPQNRLFSTSGYIFLYWMIGVSFILLIVAILFMRNQIRPIKRLAIAAEKLGKGRDVPFFKIEGAREVRQASRAFIDMRERINRQIEQRTAMLAGVSHDLRTPLTRMKLQAEMMSENEDVKELKNDIEDMQRMIDAYLQFARGDGNENIERVNVVQILERLSQNFARESFQLEINANQNQSYDLLVRPVAFERCLTNIISNAHKYAQKAWVSIERDEDNIQITIDDDGCGIKEESYEDVFKPFFREDKSRNAKTGGVGLGLPIAQDIVLSHGGDIKLSKSSKGGLRVVLSMPL
ncbi:MAG: ATP-binding protein [Alphaproteobacteria bacterium]|nr:ATP-binding protein [Alphaproteobacteria bacterium]